MAAPKPTIKSVRALSEYILDNDEFRLPNVRVLDLPKTPRISYMRQMERYFHGEQHDFLAVDWDGRPRDPGVGYLHERMNPQGFVPTNSVPAMRKRPDTSDPLPLQIVGSFTDLVFGSPPVIRAAADATTERFLAAICKESRTWDTLVAVRDHSGAIGSGALVLSVIDGKPTTESLNPCELLVTEWQDGPAWIPKSVIEQRLITKTVVVTDEKDEGKEKLEEHEFWRTRMWTAPSFDEDTGDELHPGHSITFEDVEEDFEGMLPMEDIVEHGLSRCPVVWAQNTRNPQAPEGRPDCYGAWHIFDKIDRMESQTYRATFANVDPTLVVSDDPRSRMRTELRKGYGASIQVSEKGNVKFLETDGKSIEMGWTTVHNLEDQAKSATGAVIPSDQNIGKQSSAEAIEKRWQAMEMRANRIRTAYEDTIEQICRIWIEYGLEIGIGNLESEEKSDQGKIMLPPWVQKPDEVEAPRETGKIDPKTGRPELEAMEQSIDVIATAHKVGKGRATETDWPAYHKPTTQQIQQLAQGLNVATGNKATISQQTASEVLSSYLGRTEPAEERRRLQRQKVEAQAEFGDEFGDDEGALQEERRKGADAEVEEEFEDDGKGKAGGKE